jgi:phosphoribosylformylglycinamidine synthase
VQVGDPFTEKLLIEACLEMYDAKLVQGIQDLGGAGLTCALTETAAAGRSGCCAHLDRVPLREASMEPHEVLASESQERMLAIVTPEDLPAVLRIADKWGVLATAIGEVTDGRPAGRRLARRGRRRRAARLAGRRRPGLRAAVRPARPTRTSCRRRAPAVPTDDLGELLLRMVASPNLCSRRWVVEQYDRIVLGRHGARLARGRGRRTPLGVGLGIALSTDGNGPLHPARPVRRCAARAGRGLPQRRRHRRRPDRGDQLPELRQPRGPRRDVAVRRGHPRAGRRLPDARDPGDRRQRQLLQLDRRHGDQPDAGHRRARPVRRRRRRTPMGFAAQGESVLLLGRRATSSAARSGPGPSTGTSAAARRPSTWSGERVLGEVLVAGSRDGMLSSAHDLSDGGLARRWSRRRWRTASGADRAAAGAGPVRAAVQRVAGRAVVTVPRSEELRFTEMCDARGPARAPGSASRTGRPRRAGRPVAAARAAARGPRADAPALFGPLAGDTAPSNPVATGPATGSVTAEPPAS